MKKVDIAIIGGGLTGCAAAYYLAKAGARPWVIERGDLNTRASGANAGSIHLQIPHGTFTRNGEEWAHQYGPSLRLLAASIELWRGLSDELQVDLEFVQRGGLLVADTEAQFADIERKMDVERAYDVPVAWIASDELCSRAPYLSSNILGAAYCPLEGKANPLIATFAYARAAARLGAQFLTHTPVTGLEPSDGGYRIECGASTIEARVVVNAAGTDAARIAALVGVKLDILADPLQVAVTTPVSDIVSHLVYYAGAKLTLKQTSNGSLLIGGGWPSKPSAALPGLRIDPKSLSDNLLAAARVIPAVSGCDVIRSWPAIVNGTDDWRPILSEALDLSGFYIAFFPWMGFTGGPIAGRIIADLILDGGTDQDIEPFSIAGHQRRANKRGFPRRWDNLLHRLKD